MKIPQAVASLTALMSLGALASTAPAQAADVDTLDTSAIAAEVAATSPSSSELAQLSTLDQVTKLNRCVDLATERYCIGLGFVDVDPSYERLANAANAAPVSDPTGAMSTADWVRTRLEMSDAERIEAEQDEIDVALAGVEKARTERLRTEVTQSGGFSQADIGTQAAVGGPYTIMTGYQTKQGKTYYCGPATMQSIDWGDPGDDGVKDTQNVWADILGTTAGSGTGISALVSTTNSSTTWDNYVNSYIVGSVSSWNTATWYDKHWNHFGGNPNARSRKAPIIEHVMLKKAYFPYLKYDHGGHFQVGRGAKWASETDPKTIYYFEVYNENDWYSSVTTDTWGPRTIASSTYLNATKAHAQQNIGY